MAINLQDLRAAVQTYLDTKVGVSISPLTAAVPVAISPNEEFSFSVTVSNSTIASGGIKLINVRYHLSVDNPGIGKLIVPPVATATARAGSLPTSVLLLPGSLVDSMFLFPADSKLEAGDSDAISGLRGKAAVLGSTSIRFHVHADPDLSFLFPTDETSADTTRTLNVV